MVATGAGSSAGRFAGPRYDPETVLVGVAGAAPPAAGTDTASLHQGARSLGCR